MSVEASRATPSAPLADVGASPEASLAFASLPVGSRLGRYQIVQRIARGGMAELYVARCVAKGGFEKLVALKRILPHLGEDSAFVRMFLNEARVSAMLDHSNIAHVIDFGSEGHEHYLVMEYVHGHSVQELLRRTAGGERIPLGVGLSIAYELATALHYAHEKTASDGLPLGLVHRDVSPSNVLLSEYGGVKLVDFGIAKATEHTRATESGVIKGKLSYMAPEQVRGEVVDRRADVFALGVVTYELTTGRKCFRAAGEFALINRVAQGRYARPSSLDPAFPPELEAILAQAMAVDPAARTPTAEAFARAVSHFAQGAGLSMSRLDLADYLGSVFDPKPAPPPMPKAAAPMTTVAVPTLKSVEIVAAAEPSTVSRRKWMWAAGTLVVGVGLGLVAARGSQTVAGAPAMAESSGAFEAVPAAAQAHAEGSLAPLREPSPAVSALPEPDASPAKAPSVRKTRTKSHKPRRSPARRRPESSPKAPEYLPPSYR